MRAARVTLRLVRACIRTWTFWTIENPAHSGLWKWPPLARLIASTPGCHVCYIDVCEYGACFKKPTRIAGTLPNLLSLERTCLGGHFHERLSGTVSTVRDGKVRKGWRTGFASAYTPAFARAFALLSWQSRGNDATQKAFAEPEADRARWKTLLTRASGAPEPAANPAVPRERCGCEILKLPPDGSREWPKQEGWDCHISSVPPRAGLARSGAAGH
jgi:hypothetical protein